MPDNQRIGYKHLIPGVSTLSDVTKEFGGPNLRDITGDGPHTLEWFGTGYTIATQKVSFLKFGFVGDRLACLSVSFPRMEIEAVAKAVNAKHPNRPDDGPTEVLFENNKDEAKAVFMDRELLVEFKRLRQEARDERFRRMVEDV